MADADAVVPSGSAALADWDDVSLVERSTSGDQNAFAVLVRRYQAPLFRHALRLTQDRPTAEDVIQDAFVTAWQRLPSLARAESFRPWLYQIATRRSIDLLRRRRDQQPLDADHDVATSKPADDPARAVETRAQLDALNDAISRLPVPQRLVWALREIDGLSYDEIAIVAGVPVSTVRGRIARARRELAERMEPWQTTRD